jgi:hypothetical protein
MHGRQHSSTDRNYTINPGGGGSHEVTTPTTTPLTRQTETYFSISHQLTRIRTPRRDTTDNGGTHVQLRTLELSSAAHALETAAKRRPTLDSRVRYDRSHDGHARRRRRYATAGDHVLRAWPYDRVNCIRQTRKTISHYRPGVPCNKNELVREWRYMR